MSHRRLIFHVFLLTSAKTFDLGDTVQRFELSYQMERQSDSMKQNPTSKS